MIIRCHRYRGFTLPELLVAGALSAAFFTAAAMSFQAITYNQKRYAGLAAVTITPTGDLSGAVGNFYPNLAGPPAQTVLNVYGAPSYGRAASAQNLYDRFWEDMEKASAAFCLSRNGKLNKAGTATNTLRPTQMAFPSGLSFTDVDTSSAFLNLVLDSHENDATNIYTAFRNVAPVPAIADAMHAGGTVYIIQPYDVSDQIGVRAIYEIDLLKVSSPIGVYASVRRYVGNQLSDYYDVFYEDAKVGDFGPLFVAFEKDSRRILVESGTDSYALQPTAIKLAPERHSSSCGGPIPHSSR